MATGAGDAYWIVACSASEQPREAIYSILRSRIQNNSLASDSAVLDVPKELKFGSFDDLIRMADDLIKHDSTCEQVVRRLERQVLEIDPSAELKVIYQRITMTVDQYLHRFVWDEGRYPKSRQMRDNIEMLISTITRIDDEVRVKAGAFNETKQSHATASRKDATNFTQRDLIDVLTPEKVANDDFVDTEHLTTVAVVVPSGLEDMWLNTYEGLDSFVVPRSTKKFPGTDKEGNTLWKVTIFKSSLEAFRSAARAKRFIIREFKYNPNALSTKLEERSKLEAEKNKQESFMSRVCLASFSDACIAWVHIKTMRVFVEAVLRFGVPPNFATFLIKPCHSKEKKLRKELDDIFTTKGMFGRALIENDRHKSSATGDNPAVAAALAAELGEDEYYPYVSLTFTPFAVFTQK